MERSEFYQSLFERARAAGFSACEAYYAAGESFSVTVFGGEITDYSASESRGLGFRGLVDGKMVTPPRRRWTRIPSNCW